jgi:phage replication O-like protein O
VENPYRKSSTINPQRENGRREVANEIWRALALASLPGGEYQVVIVVIDRTWGYGKQSASISLDYFEKTTRLTRPGVIKAIKHLSEKRIVLRQTNGTKTTEYLFNKHFDTWLIEVPSKPEFTRSESQLVNGGLLSWYTGVYQSSKPEFTSASKLAIASSTPAKEIYKENFKENFKEIYSKWNEQKVYVHKSPTGEMETAVKKALKSHSVEEICQAIRNYAEIVKGERYYFKYRWTLKDFLGRGLEKFMDIEVARGNYMIEGSKGKGGRDERVIRESTAGRKPWTAIREDGKSREESGASLP